jgi:hypothetical protein
MSDNKCGGGSGPVLGSSLWLIGWLFTIGYLHLTLWIALLALLIWPYFLGHALAPAP